MTPPKAAPSEVVLRPLAIADVPTIFAAVRESYAELSPWMPWCTPDYEEARVLEHVVNCEKQRQVGLVYEFGIFGSDGEYFGSCGLNGVSVEHKFANLGYWIRTPRTGQGVATSAVRLLAQWAFEHTDLNRLEVLVAVDNVASQRVAERAGAQKEGVLQQRLVLRGRAHDALVYGFVRTRRQP